MGAGRVHARGAWEARTRVGPDAPAELLPLRSLGWSLGSAPCGFHRWRGDYGGKKQLWFPSNYVEEMVSPAALEPEREVRAGPRRWEGIPVPSLPHGIHPPCTRTALLWSHHHMQAAV